jgi:hypothetical protein
MYVYNAVLYILCIIQNNIRTFMYVYYAVLYIYIYVDYAVLYIYIMYNTK